MHSIAINYGVGDNEELLLPLPPSLLFIVILISLHIIPHFAGKLLR